MKRKSLLAVFPVAPWPVRDSGISIRYYPILEKLSHNYNVDLLVLGDFRESLPDDPLLKHVSSEVHFFNRAPAPDLWTRLRTWGEVLSPFGAPYEYASYHTDAVFDVLRRKVHARHYDTLLWVCPYNRAALDRLIPTLKRTRVVFDCVDSPLLHYVRSAQEQGHSSLARRLDQWKTRRWERGLSRNVDASVYISHVDAGAASEDALRSISVIPNGIFVGDLPPQRSSAAERVYIGFLGHMGYTPNIQAAVRLHDHIFRPLQKDFPELNLMIIGRSPAPQVQRLAADDVVVTGTVENIWEYIDKVRLFVFPMSSGAGLQNKLLEAMYAGKPVVTTEICRSSLGAMRGREVLSGNSNEELREQVKLLLNDEKLATAIGFASQAFVREKYEISRVLDEYESLLFPV